MSAASTQPAHPRGFHRATSWRVRFLRSLCTLTLGLGLGLVFVGRAEPLADGWNNPPRDARVRAYWWWLNGNVTPAAITRDLEAMRDQGFGGALICDADGSSQDGNDRVPGGPPFGSPAWRALYRHALHEAARLGLELSLNIQSGWNLGGPQVSPDDAPKKLVWTETVVTGPAPSAGPLARPAGRDGYYRDLFVVAVPRHAETTPGSGQPPPATLRNWRQKALLQALHFSAPDTTPLLVEDPETPGEAAARVREVRDLTSKLAADGALRWAVPEGTWEILRIGCTLNDHCRVSTSSEGWQGYALDPFDADAFRRYWEAVVEPLIADAGSLAGSTLRYLHTDSWEVEVANWTPTLRQEFRRRRGYDLVPYLPVLAGRILDSRRVSHRFLHDFRRTLGDLAIDHHYRLFRDGARRHGLLIHPESGGPHAVPIDAQQCLGFTDAPMSEFWAWSWRHRVGDTNRFFVKQPAAAAHTYGRRLVLAEGFTTIGPHWQETLWDNLKPSFERALCEGLNLLVWHAFVCSPAEMGLPGQQYFAGTHLNPNVTWWPQSRPFFDYLNRCQWMLQQGRFVADVAYYYGDHVPNFAQLRRSDPARLGPGYDYDVVTEEVILRRLSVADGRLRLPDGMEYRLLVLPDRTAISLPVLRRLADLVHAGATVVGPRPTEATTLQGFPGCDATVTRIARRLWGAEPPTADPRTVGQGRVFHTTSARDVLAHDGVPPDFEFQSSLPELVLDYIHRRDGDTEVYFIANRSNCAASARCTFRVQDKTPELWNPVTGRRHAGGPVDRRTGRSTLTLTFEPFGSWFVVWRDPAAPSEPPSSPPPPSHWMVLEEINGPWTVRFDPAWGGPATTTFAALQSWTEHPDPGVKYYSGRATYERPLNRPPSAAAAAQRLWLDLGTVRELAEVRVNGQACGIVWAPPCRVDLTDALRPGTNRVEIEVVNFWPNRIIGDAALPAEQRRTRTNIRKLTADTPLMPSGLLGPVRLLGTAQEPSH